MPSGEVALMAKDLANIISTRLDQMVMPLLDILNKEINPINYTIILFILATVFIGYGFDIIKNGYKILDTNKHFSRFC